MVVPYVQVKLIQYLIEIISDSVQPNTKNVSPSLTPELKVAETLIWRAG